MKFLKIVFALLVMSTPSLAQSTAIVKSMLIFPGQDKHVHGSSLVRLPNGDYLSVWFYGSGERTADDVKLMGARLKRGILDGVSHF